MFDGNYRSRRQVNLSGRRRKSRDSILEESRRQRQERVKTVERINAARSIQRVSRGHVVRNKLILQLEESLENNEELSLLEHTRVLNFRLSLPLHNKKQEDANKTLQRWCADYATHIVQAATTPSETTVRGPFFLVHRILQAVFQLVRNQMLPFDDCQGIVDHCFSDLRQQQPQPAARFSSQTEYWKRLGFARGYLALIETLQVLLSFSSKCRDATVSSQGDDPVELTRELYKLAEIATPPTDSGKAVLGALVLSQPSVFRRQADIPIVLGVSDDPAVTYQNLLLPLVSVLTSTSTSSLLNDPMTLAVQSIENSKQDVIMSNALDLYRLQSSKPNPAALLRLLQRILHRHPDLALLVSLLVKGEDVHAILSHGALEEEKGAPTDYSDDESNDEEESRVHAPPSSSTMAETHSLQKVRTGTRLTKQDLQTLPRIDRLYQAELAKWRQECLTNIGSSERKETLLDLATQIVDAEQWISWGNSLLLTMQDSEELWLAREAYVTLLATLLQSSTGLRARQSASSPFLTKLAFDKDFSERLWRYILMLVTNNEPTRVTYVAFSVFCDVFTHRLIALKDDQFLAAYTTMQGSRVVLAEHVIVNLRTLLYELYWSRPVRAWDIKVAFGTQLSEEERSEAVRGRLLVTGTKLWNSLYERWCRLVRKTPFCDESTWLFPHMITLTNENAVVGLGGPRRSDNIEDMDLDSDSDNDDDHPMTEADAESEALADAFSDPKMARILTSIPQVLPFDRRVKLFDSLLTRDKMKTQDESAEMREAMLMMMRGEEGGALGREHVEIHRDRIYEDSMRQLNVLGPKLKRRVQVTFINEHGVEEAGIDGGGVFKEFVDDLITNAFSTNDSTGLLQEHHPLFTITPSETLRVNSALTQDPSKLPHYEFLGRVMGKAVYESILVEPQFCLPFLNQLLGKPNSLEDLKNFDMEYYKNLTKLLSMSADDVNNLGLTFEITLGKGLSSRTVALLPGGSTKAVTKDNVIQYVHLVAHQQVNVESAMQTKAFLRGFRDLIPASWVRLFSAYELQKLISGDDSVRGIDVGSLKAAMQYAGGYHPSQPVIQWFWEILDEMTANEQRKFLKFMTSCSRQPLLGFSSLEPAPCVQQIRLPDGVFEGDPDKTTPLPTSSTCMNLLKLPNYRSKKLMRKKLLAAIESGAGFELT